MEVNFKRFSIEIVFEREVIFSIYPPFIFRSILGKELRKLSCIKRRQNCVDCDLRFQCIYSRIFETPISKNNEVLKNRNFGTHPFVLSTDTGVFGKSKKIKMELILIGYAIDYLPYIYYSLKKAGESGIFKERIRFNISSMKTDDKELIINQENIDKNFTNDSWKISNSGGDFNGKILLSFQSPLRVKIAGKYRNRISYDDFIDVAYRRLSILTKLYGKYEKPDNLKIENDKEEESHLSWQELERYSARQKTIMKLGGIIGQMEVSGIFNNYEVSIIKGAEIFNIGKNTSFGLGKVRIKNKELRSKDGV